MRSKTSFFNVTLFRKNLTRFWPLWALVSFLGSLFPLAMLLEQIRWGGDWNPLTISAGYYSVLSGAVPIVSLLYAVLCAMLVWSYLYNARSVSLAHTLPIRREGLFLTNFLSGLAMMLIPYAIVGALCVLLSLVYGGFEPVGLLLTILGVVGESFFYFATATFAAFLTGNLFALPVLYFLLHFLAPLLDLLTAVLAQGFLFGLNTDYTGAAEWLSPTVYLMKHVRIDRTWEEVEHVAENGEHWFSSEVVAVQMDGLWLIGVYALVGAALLALAYALYRRRHSERAGDVAAAGWLRPVFRYGAAFLTAALGGVLLYQLFWSNFQNGRYYEVLPMLVCMLVAGAIGYYAASMLLEKSLKVFRGSWKGITVLAVFCAALCGVLHFDLLGVAGKVPGIGGVEKVELRVAENSYTFYPTEDADLLQQVRDVHYAILADEAYIRTGEAEGWKYAQVDGDDITYTYVDLDYTLKNGKTVSRGYSIPVTKDRLTQTGTYDYALDQLVNSEAMKLKRLNGGDSGLVPAGGGVYVDGRGPGYDFNSREAQAVLDAVSRDAAAGNWGTYDWFGNDRGSRYAMNVEIAFTWAEKEDGVDRGTAAWINVYLRPGMTETVRCLLDMGAVKATDLKTYAELYPQEYRAESQGPFDGTVDSGMAFVEPDEYVFDVATEEAILREDTKKSVGVVGGADGPTAIIVS